MIRAVESGEQLTEIGQRGYVSACLRSAPVAYVEAEFFGGSGDQSAVVFEQGSVVLEAVQAEDAINRAMRVLEVEIGSHHDEFAALGPGDGVPAVDDDVVVVPGDAQRMHSVGRVERVEHQQIEMVMSASPERKARLKGPNAIP